MDAISSSHAESWFETLFQEGLDSRNLLVDFTELDFVGSTGIRVFIKALKTLQPTSSRMFFFGMNVQVDEVFRFAGLNTLVTMVATEAEGLNQFTD
jgi:anti-anti-sigma factor